MAKYFIIVDYEPADAFDTKTELEEELAIYKRKYKSSIITVEDINGEILWSNDPEWEHVEKTYVADEDVKINWKKMRK